MILWPKVVTYSFTDPLGNFASTLTVFPSSGKLNHNPKDKSGGSGWVFSLYMYYVSLSTEGLTFMLSLLCLVIYLQPPQLAQLTVLITLGT